MKPISASIKMVFWLVIALCFAAASPAAGAYNDLVYQAQKQLVIRGYDPGPLDGIWGGRTKRAVAQYQKDRNLSASGDLDDATRSGLGISSAHRAIRPKPPIASSIRLLKPIEPLNERRLALVIGNSAYRKYPLHNPVHDARDISDILKNAGFEVMMYENADRLRMESAIRQFGQVLKDGGVGLFYFAGHGMEVDGSNYLIPIGAEIEKEIDAMAETVDAGLVLNEMESAGNGLNIMILDACRNNPNADGIGTLRNGLTRMEAPPGTFIVYATAPGRTAEDGKGSNSVFTHRLLEHMNTPGLKIEDVLKKVRIDVMNDTGNRQVPWQASSLTRDFYFIPKTDAVAEVETDGSKENAASVGDPAESLFWQSVEKSQNPDYFKAYLEKYPDGIYAELARVKLKELETSRIAYHIPQRIQRPTPRAPSSSDYRNPKTRVVVKRVWSYGSKPVKKPSVVRIKRKARHDATVKKRRNPGTRKIRSARSQRMAGRSHPYAFDTFKKQLRQTRRWHRSTYKAASRNARKLTMPRRGAWRRGASRVRIGR